MDYKVDEEEPRLMNQSKIFKQVFTKQILFILVLILIFSSSAWGKKKKYLVAIDPGHGGLNLGSLDPRVKGNFEKTYTLIIAKHVRDYLVKSGVYVWMSRTKDIPLSLQNRMKRASATGSPPTQPPSPRATT